MVRKMEPQAALDVLRFTKKYAANDLEKAIKTALGNAKTAKFESIVFKSIEINEGPKMRRFKAGTRGRVKPFRRKMAHIKIVLTDSQIQNEAQKPKNKEEKAKKEEVKK